MSLSVSPPKQKLSFIVRNRKLFKVQDTVSLLSKMIEKSKNKQAALPESSIYLCAPVNALVEGISEENITFAEIKKHGDFGLGTFNDLDGEMVMLDGNVYQITAEGKVVAIGDDVLTPFACVTFYKPLSHDEISSEMNYEDFIAFINRLLPSPNIFYAIRIDGWFSHIKARSIPKQEMYLPLAEATKEQSIFSFSDVEGTVAGFFTPAFVPSVSVPGFHLHFLSSDRKHGGHVLECRPRNVRIGVQFISKIELSLPMSIDYLTEDFKRDVKRDLEKAEK
jgi:acetolactate decarboxylase